MIISNRRLFNDLTAENLYCFIDLLDMEVAEKIISAIQKRSDITATINFHHKLGDILRDAGVDMQDNDLVSSIYRWLKQVELYDIEDELSADLDEMTRSLDYWKDTYYNLSKNWDRMYDQKEQLRRDCDNLTTQINNTRMRVDDLRVQNAALREQVAIADGVIAQADETAEQLKKYGELKVEFSALLADRTVLHRQIDQLTATIEFMDSQHADLRDEVEAYRANNRIDSDRIQKQQDVICEQEDRIRQLEKALADMVLKHGV